MSESLLTIVFRGLIVVNMQGTGENSYCEMGILHGAPGHFMRINTIKNCVLESVKPITEKYISALAPEWELVVSNPVDRGVTTRTQGEKFNRLDHPFAEDFRWLIDLEDNEFYGNDLTGQLHLVDSLMPVIRVPYGQFYTRLKSRELDRSKGTAGTLENFGFMSVAVGCDIKLNKDTRVILKAKAKDSTIPDFSFEFDQREPHTIYEIVNSPPDISEVEHHHEHVEEHEHTTTGPSESQLADHFQHYYLMFNDPNVVKFHFEETGGAPGPRPMLCGMVKLGSRTINVHDNPSS